VLYVACLPYDVNLDADLQSNIKHSNSKSRVTEFIIDYWVELQLYRVLQTDITRYRKGTHFSENNCWTIDISHMTCPDLVTVELIHVPFTPTDQDFLLISYKSHYYKKYLFTSSLHFYNVLE
jgi:hypothetical protein